MVEVINSFIGGDIMEFIKHIGLIGVYFVIFAESGLLIGFFLPGDSLLFTAGLLASSAFGFFNITTLLLGTWVAAILGDNVGYEFGHRVGRQLFKRPKSLLFNPENLLKAQLFYEKHGGKAIVLARFIPIVRTFAPIVAGVGNMDRKNFMLFNFIGGTLWTWLMVLGGYFLGGIIPKEDVDKYMLPIIMLIILISILPPVIHLYKENKKTWIEKLKEKIAFFRLKL